MKLFQNLIIIWNYDSLIEIYYRMKNYIVNRLKVRSRSRKYFNKAKENITQSFRETVKENITQSIKEAPTNAFVSYDNLSTRDIDFIQNEKPMKIKISNNTVFIPLEEVTLISQMKIIKLKIHFKTKNNLIFHNLPFSFNFDYGL